jgi:lysophospholipase L1-like esterase
MRAQGKIIAKAAVSCVLVFVAVESLARIGYTLKSTLSESRGQSRGQARSVGYLADWFRYSPVTGWEKRPGFRGKSDDGVDREFDAQGLLAVDSEKAAASDAQKVLFIGDSNTFGFGVPTTAGFAEYTGRLLPGVKMINLGVIGYSSYQGRKTLEKYLSKMHPAAVVVSFNVNDRRGVTAGDEDGPARFEKVYDASRSSLGPIARCLGYLYLYREMGAGMRHLGLLPAKAHEPAVNELRPRLNEEQYRENLAAMADQTSRAGIPIVFVLLRDNPLLSGYLNRGIDRLEKRDYEAAIEDLNVLVRANGMHSDLGRIYLARAYRATGRNHEAEEILREGERSIYLLGGRPVRLDRDYNAIMREVAGQYKAGLVDAASVLESDPYDYIDFCHFNSAGHRKVAELLAAELARMVRTARVSIPERGQPATQVSRAAAPGTGKSLSSGAGDGRPEPWAQRSQYGY